MVTSCREVPAPGPCPCPSPDFEGSLFRHSMPLCHPSACLHGVRQLYNVLTYCLLPAGASGSASVGGSGSGQKRARGMLKEGWRRPVAGSTGLAPRCCCVVWRERRVPRPGAGRGEARSRGRRRRSGCFPPAAAALCCSGRDAALHVRHPCQLPALCCRAARSSTQLSAAWEGVGAARTAMSGLSKAGHKQRRAGQSEHPHPTAPFITLQQSSKLQNKHRTRTRGLVNLDSFTSSSAGRERGEGKHCAALAVAFAAAMWLTGCPQCLELPAALPSCNQLCIHHGAMDAVAA